MHLLCSSTSPVEWKSSRDLHSPKPVVLSQICKNLAFSAGPGIRWGHLFYDSAFWYSIMILFHSLVTCIYYCLLFYFYATIFNPHIVQPVTHWVILLLKERNRMTMSGQKCCGSKSLLLPSSLPFPLPSNLLSKSDLISLLRSKDFCSIQKSRSEQNTGQLSKYHLKPPSCLSDKWKQSVL